MGIGGGDLRLLIELKKQGHIPNGSSIVEIGAQQLADSFLASRSEIDALSRSFGVIQPCPLPPPLAQPASAGAAPLLDSAAPWARQFWSWLGLHYAAIDIDGSPGSIPLDLNYDDVPSNFKGKYEVVTNYGTTEHVANQLNAFKVIHDLTKPGGIMIHSVPAQGMFNHGLVNYNPKFFWMLSRSNGYKWLHMNFSIAGARPLSSDIVDHVAGFNPSFAEQARGYVAPDCGLGVVLQKIYDMPYVAPLDVNTGTRTNNKMLKTRYWTVFEPGAFETIRPLTKNLDRLLSRLKQKYSAWLAP
jgi:hypothetical protein